MKKPLLVFLSLLSVLVTNGQWSNNSLPVPETDPIRSKLDKWQSEQTERYARSDFIKPQFEPWAELSSAALKELFPRYRFFTIRWNELPGEETLNGKPVSRAFGLYIILGFSEEENDDYSLFFGNGNYEEFGNFLSRQEIILRTKEHAKLIWEGFCDLHLKHWKEDREIIQKSPEVWQLGGNTIREVYYYYKINVDESGKIQSGRLHSEKIIPQMRTSRRYTIDFAGAHLCIPSTLHELLRSSRNGPRDEQAQSRRHSTRSVEQQRD